MDAEMLAALKECIRHYEAQQNGEEPGLGTDYCALCEASSKKRILAERVCIFCPIYKHTELGGCRGTPYTAWNDHVDECVACSGMSNEDYSSALPRCAVGKALHKAELNFLKSLLPKE